MVVHTRLEPAVEQRLHRTLVSGALLKGRVVERDGELAREAGRDPTVGVRNPPEGDGVAVGLFQAHRDEVVVDLVFAIRVVIARGSPTRSRVESRLGDTKIELAEVHFDPQRSETSHVSAQGPGAVVTLSLARDARDVPAEVTLNRNAVDRVSGGEHAAHQARDGAR